MHIVLAVCVHVFTVQCVQNMDATEFFVQPIYISLCVVSSVTFHQITLQNSFCPHPQQFSRIFMANPNRKLKKSNTQQCVMTTGKM